MKRIFVALLSLSLAMPVLAKGGTGYAHSGRSGHTGKAYTGRSGGKPATGTGAKIQSKNVRGYTTKRGTYVAPHRRSTADQAKTNNWTTKGNTNPHTGKPGAK